MDLTRVRMKEHTGMVTNDTTTTYVNFVVSPMKNRAHLEKNDYVALNHPIHGETCPLIATVTDIKSYEQVAGSTLSERLGKMMGIAKIIGYVDLKDKTKKIQTLVSPPDPGSRVYLIYSEFMETLFTTDANGDPYNPPISFGKQIKNSHKPKRNKQTTQLLSRPKKPHTKPHINHRSQQLRQNKSNKNNHQPTGKQNTTTHSSF